MSNAIITLGDIDDSGKGKRFKSRFIQPGLAGYPGQYGNVLVKKETLDECLNSIIGAPVIINHQDIDKNNVDEARVGVISNAYYNEKDGWYWCEGVIWDETAQNLITDKHWSVSCSYDYLQEDNEGGTENNISYDREFTKLNFRHLALVNNPRYERANIVFNSKTFKEEEHLRDEKGKFTKGNAKLSYDDFITQHKNAGLIEQYPDDFLGTTEDEIAEHLGIKGNKPAEIKTPIDVIKIYKTNIPHIIHEKDKNRLKGLNRALRTMQEPNLIIEDKKKNYYIKLFDKVGSDKTHIQIVKATPKGSYYITNYPLKKGGFNKLEGQVKYDLSSKRGFEASNINISNSNLNFNPSVTKHEAIKEQDMALIDELENLIRKVRNNKEDNMEKEKDKEVNNEDVDKREILREVDAIAMKPVSEFKGGSEEKFRTITKKLEELSYNKSSRGTADNSDDEGCKDKEVKNETEKDKDEVKDLEKDLKKDVENKCDNSVSNSKPDYFDRMNQIYNAANEPPKDHTEYVSRADRLKAAEEYFG